jgi:serine phosphatase RsbU (regulator of sigma subunit)
MEYEARKFARRVLLVHMAALLVVLAVVAAAARVVYFNARNQALQQATHTQELLARQTALGIQNYYETVSGVLNLLQPQEGDPTTQRAAQETDRREPDPRQIAARRERLDRGEGPMARIRSETSKAIWSSIRDPASLLFVVDPADDMRVVETVGSDERDFPPTPQEVVSKKRDWLQTVRTHSVSSFVTFSSGGGAHVVCVPLRGQARLLMVCLVPISALERDVLASVNKSSTTGAMVVDQTGTFVSATVPGAVGRNVTQFNEPRLRKLAAEYMTQRRQGTEIFDRAETIGDATLRPGMSTIMPMEVLSQPWFLIVSSDLGAVDQLVRPVFKDLLLWGIFLGVCIFLILFSTSAQLIRSRLRLERMQRDVMAKEMADARQIQLKWLPKEQCKAQGLEIAALNTPATHISGDFYNWFDLPDGRIVVTIGDVTGHGMAAAFLMASSQLLIRSIMPRVPDPGTCLTEVNQQMCMQTFNGQFVTLLILVLDPCTGTMELATAGHQAPLIGAGGDFAELPVEPDLVLGVERDTTYRTQRFDLPAGAHLVLYTDGAIDAQSPEGTRFSTEGLAASLHGRYESAASVVDAVRSAVDEFRQGRDLADDLTVVAIQLHSQRTLPRHPQTAAAVVAS